MKKIMLILFAILVIMSLSACAGETSEPTEADTEAPEVAAPEEEAPEEEAPAGPETIKIGTLKKIPRQGMI